MVLMAPGRNPSQKVSFIAQVWRAKGRLARQRAARRPPSTLRAHWGTWNAPFRTSESRGDAVPNEIRMISSTALKTSIDELQPGFENQTDSVLTVSYGPSARMTKQIADGEPCDL